ncbi:hypothetical protein EJB05_44426, partial [Eragrostis curvula]
MFPERLHYCLLLTFVHSCYLHYRRQSLCNHCFGGLHGRLRQQQHSDIKSNFPPYGRDFDSGVATGRLVTDFISESFGLPPSVPAFLDKHRDIDQLATGIDYFLLLAAKRSGSSRGRRAADGAGTAQGLHRRLGAVILASPSPRCLPTKMRHQDSPAGCGDEVRSVNFEGKWLHLTAAWVAAPIADLKLQQDADPDELSVAPGRCRAASHHLFRRAQYSPPEYAAYLAGRASEAAREAYYHGARKIVFVSLLPVGCLPGRRAVNHDGPGKCNEKYNNLAMMFNAEIQETMGKLNGELAGAQVVYTEMYSVVSAILANPSAYGGRFLKSRPARVPAIRFLGSASSRPLAALPSPNDYFLFDVYFIFDDQTLLPSGICLIVSALLYFDQVYLMPC